MPQSSHIVDRLVPHDHANFRCGQIKLLGGYRATNNLAGDLAGESEMGANTALTVVPIPHTVCRSVWLKFLMSSV